jgi:hypothetical protein
MVENHQNDWDGPEEQALAILERPLRQRLATRARELSELRLLGENTPKPDLRGKRTRGTLCLVFRGCGVGLFLKWQNVAGN